MTMNIKSQIIAAKTLQIEWDTQVQYQVKCDLSSALRPHRVINMVWLLEGSRSWTQILKFPRSHSSKQRPPSLSRWFSLELL